MSADKAAKSRPQQKNLRLEMSDLTAFVRVCAIASLGGSLNLLSATATTIKKK